MFPVHINDGSSPLPEDDVYYVVGKNGVFIRKNLGIVDSLAKVDNISILEDVEEYASLNVPKLSSKLIHEMVNFLRWVYEEFRSEGMSILHYNDKKETFKNQVPHQWVSGGGIDYVKNVSFANFVKLGSIHSHANFSAFHSPTDKDDEFDWDGLHITIGHIADQAQSISASIVVNKLRFLVHPLEYIEGITQLDEEGKYFRFNDLHEYSDFPESWKMFVERSTERPKVESLYGSLGYGRGTTMTRILSNWAKNQSLFDAQDNPCEKCPYREYKVELQMEEIIDEIDAHDLAMEDDEEENDGLTEHGDDTGPYTGNYGYDMDHEKHRGHGCHGKG